MIGKLLLSFFISVSLRTAKVENCKPDYQIAYGFNTKYSVIEIENERENNVYYNNYDIQLFNLNLKASYLKKESKSIDLETLSWRKPFFADIFYIGLSENWTKWRNPRTLVDAGIDLKFLKINSSTNFNDRRILSIYLGKRIFMKKRKNLYIEPFYKVNIVNDKTYFQLKIKIGWIK